MHVNRQVFAKVGHPAGQAEIDHILPDHALGKPGARFGVGEVDDTTIELAEIDACRPAFTIGGEKALRISFREQGAVDREIWIDVAEEPNAAIRHFGDTLPQSRIALLIRLPIPEQARAEGCVTQPDPILAPEARHSGSSLDEGLQALERACPILQADDGAAIDPFGQWRLPSEAPRESLDKADESRAREKLDPIRDG